MRRDVGTTSVRVCHCPRSTEVTNNNKTNQNRSVSNRYSTCHLDRSEVHRHLEHLTTTTIRNDKDNTRYNLKYYQRKCQILNNIECYHHLICEQGSRSGWQSTEHSARERELSVQSCRIVTGGGFADKTQNIYTHRTAESQQSSECLQTTVAA
jgi:hypothetical protein